VCSYVCGTVFCVFEFCETELSTTCTVTHLSKTSNEQHNRIQCQKLIVNGTVRQTHKGVPDIITNQNQRKGKLLWPSKKNMLLKW
jgi:hypothetical protein